MDDSRLRLFRREAETLARLKHPHIAAIYESGRTDDGEHFFAMELVVGQDLDDWLQARPATITPDELRLRLFLFRQIAEAGRTVFLSTHSLDVAQEVCDRLMIIYQGQIIAQGTYEELRERAEGAKDLEEIFIQLVEEESSSAQQEAS